MKSSFKLEIHIGDEMIIVEGIKPDDERLRKLFAMTKQYALSIVVEPNEWTGALVGRLKYSQSKTLVEEDSQRESSSREAGEVALEPQQLKNLAETIQSLECPVRAYNALERQYKFLWQICALTDHELRMIPGIGEVSLLAIKKSLNSMGLDTGMRLQIAAFATSFP